MTTKLAGLALSVASASALLCGSAVAAGSLTATPITIDKATAPSEINLPDITVTFANSLVHQDFVSIVVAGANSDVGSAGTVSCNEPGSSLGYLYSYESTWYFRVTSWPDPIGFGEVCTFRGLKIGTSSIGEVCQLTASYQATTPQRVEIDHGGPVTIANIAPPCGPPPPVINVAVDIRPATMPNSVNLRSLGNLSVAILSDTTFYAPSEIAVATLRFGRIGTEASLQRCNTWPEDVNNDGLLDLVCHFDTQMAAFQAGDTQGVLNGETIGGMKVMGTDSVRIVP